MYLGNGYTFSSLDSFINGFTMAASDRQLEYKGYPNFKYFSTWLLGHLDVNFGLSLGWHWQITNRSENNDEKAFEDFFNFLEIFKLSKVHSKVIVVDNDAVEFNGTSAVKTFEMINGKRVRPNQKPLKIKWTTIDNSNTVWLDYIDKNDKAIFLGDWTTSADAATEKLVKEFGFFKNCWTEVN